MTDRLFQPLKLGHGQLQHRLVMAPLTRFRADGHNNPSKHAKLYYEQRACVPGTLIVTEATFISPQAGGYPSIPGIWSESQIAGWKEIVGAVHRKGTLVYLQLWALGRVAKEEVLAKGGFRVRSASAIPVDEGQTSAGGPTTVPDEMTEGEIRSFVKDYADAARNAMKAGFDGVEIHGANGYLIDQFWQDVSNQRSDKYGGSIENRARFGLEVTKAVIEAVGNDPKKVGMRLSPWGNFQGMLMKDPVPQFKYIVDELRKLDLAYLHLIESRVSGSAADGVYRSAEEGGTKENDPFIKAWGTELPLILAGGFTPEKARKVVGEQYTEDNVAIAFGRSFISTPDLAFRIQHEIPLNPWDRPTFYKAGPGGYIDYPFSKEFLAQDSRL